MSDASTPDKDSLVGLQKMAALNSNTATRHILDASNYLTKNTAQAISYRIADVLKYSNLKEDLARKIGKTAVLDLESVKNLHLYDFAIYFELALDEEERAKLEIDLTKEIDKGYITTEMKFQILNIKNMRLATQYLGILRKKFAKKQEEQKKREYDYQSEANIRSAQEAEKARQQTIAMELDAKIQVQQMISQGEIAKEQVRGQQDRETLEMKIQGDLQITSMQTGAQIQKQTEAEDRKDKRTQLQATQQSELIAQRQRDEDPKNFEEPEELDMFTLNQIQ
jgi:hypothetical protein